MSETKGKYRFRIAVETGFAGAEHEDHIVVEDFGITREKWDAQTEEYRQDSLNSWATDFMNNHISFYWQAVGEDE